MEQYDYRVEYAKQKRAEESRITLPHVQEQIKKLNKLCETIQKGTGCYGVEGVGNLYNFYWSGHYGGCPCCLTLSSGSIRTVYEAVMAVQHVKGLNL